jgi:Flp pilus assembly protein TadD
MRNGFRTLAVAAMVLTALVATDAEAGDRDRKEAKAEMKWGFKAAKRGYWQEALMRFENANKLTPDSPRILNNIAVAQEANGMFEEALLTYQTALTINSRDDALRRNYTRFQEFYSTYVSPPDALAAADEESEEGGDDATQDN